MKCSSLTPFRVCLSALLTMFLLSCLDGDNRAAWLKERCPRLGELADCWAKCSRFMGTVSLNKWEKKTIDHLAESPVLGLSIIGAVELPLPEEPSGDRVMDDADTVTPEDEPPNFEADEEPDMESAGKMPLEGVAEEGEAEAPVFPVYVPDLKEICCPFLEAVHCGALVRVKEKIRDKFIWTGHVSFLLNNYGWKREGGMDERENLVRMGSSLAFGLLSEVKTRLSFNTVENGGGVEASLENSVLCLESVYEELCTRRPDEKKNSIGGDLTTAEKALLYSEAVFDEFRTRSSKEKAHPSLRDRMRTVARNRKPLLEKQKPAGMVLLDPAIPKAVVPKAAVPRRFLLVGDSMMEDFGPVLQRSLHRRKELKFVQAGKHSTGLTRPDYYDWPLNLRDYLKKHKPDVVVFFMGANDPQPIRENKKFYNTCSWEWQDAYSRRVKEMVDISMSHGARVLWVGLPVMGVTPLDAHVKVINQVQKKACDESGVPFVDTEPTLADQEGKFQSFIKDERNRLIRLRTKDKQHMTPAGNKILVEQFLPVMEKFLDDMQNTGSKPEGKNRSSVAGAS